MTREGVKRQIPNLARERDVVFFKSCSIVSRILLFRLTSNENDVFDML